MSTVEIAGTSIRRRISADSAVCCKSMATPAPLACCGEADDASQLAFCWAHVRRKFHGVRVATKSPLAAAALRRIAALYAIRDAIRGMPAEHCRAQRQQPATWLTDVLQRFVVGATRHNQLHTLLPWNWKAANVAEAPNSA